MNLPTGWRESAYFKKSVDKVGELVLPLQMFSAKRVRKCRIAPAPKKFAFKQWTPKFYKENSRMKLSKKTALWLAAAALALLLMSFTCAASENYGTPIDLYINNSSVDGAKLINGTAYAPYRAMILAADPDATFEWDTHRNTSVATALGMRVEYPKKPLHRVRAVTARQTTEQPPIISDFLTVLKPRSLIAPKVTAVSSPPTTAKIQNIRFIFPSAKSTPTRYAPTMPTTSAQTM